MNTQIQEDPSDLALLSSVYSSRSFLNTPGARYETLTCLVSHRVDVRVLTF